MAREAAAVFPVHRLHLRMSGRQLTVLHVRNEGRTGNYFQTEVQGGDEEQQRINALLTGLGSVPYGSHVYVHTPIKGLKELLRQSANVYPKPVRQAMKTKHLRLQGGSSEYFEPFWKDLLDYYGAGTLPHLGPMEHYRLHTYAVTDGVQTHASGLLYGEGEIHLHHGRYQGEQLQRGELEMACWALDLVGVAKAIDLRHQHPLTTEFWEKTEEYIAERPDIKPLANRIGGLISKKQLRFNVPVVRQDDVLARAVRLRTGLHLR